MRLPLDEKIGFALPTPDPEVVVAGLPVGPRPPAPDPRRAQPDPGSGAGALGNRLNSGQVGPDGAVYFGTMDDAEEQATGTFYRYDGRASMRSGGASAVTNGPVASADGRTLSTRSTPPPG